MDDKELLGHYKRTGDLDALGKLYAPYMSLLYGVCYKYLQDASLSQDAVMSIFDELVEKLKRHQVDNFKSWLYVYARNYCLMQLRKAKRVKMVDIDDHLLESEKQMNNQDESKWEETDYQKLNHCISLLKKEQKACVRLFYLDQKCYKDIALETGYDLSKVKSHIQNGRRNLKVCMEKK